MPTRSAFCSAIRLTRCAGSARPLAALNVIAVSVLTGREFPFDSTAGESTISISLVTFASLAAELAHRQCSLTPAEVRGIRYADDLINFVATSGMGRELGRGQQTCVDSFGG